ncbi:hypothetical protein QW131_26510 [Roseibium salinum]|nr:hypothetical protein [Roseibium salinum]
MPKGSRDGARIRATWREWSLSKVKLGGAAAAGLGLSSGPAAAGIVSGTLAAINPGTMILFGALGGMCLFSVTAAIALVRHRRLAAQITGSLEKEKERPEIPGRPPGSHAQHRRAARDRLDRQRRHAADLGHPSGKSRAYRARRHSSWHSAAG